FEKLIGKTFAEGVRNQTDDDKSTRHSNDEGEEEVWKNDFEADAHGICLSRPMKSTPIIKRKKEKTIRIGYTSGKPANVSAMWTVYKEKTDLVGKMYLQTGEKSLTLPTQEGV
ncbi:MAG TPA: hypothetical protein VKP08_16130, partial [Anaerolineales bacterium]|nr:hypothetical protein [Anaerolineales bacterium]